MAATMPPPMRKLTGSTTRSTTTMMTAPSTPTSCLVAGPRLHLHEGAARELGDADGRAGGPVVTERSDVDLVHRVVVAHVAQEDGGLHDVVERGALGREESRHVLEGLRELAGHAAGDERAVDEAELARHHEPLAGAHDRRVGTDGRGRRVAHVILAVSAFGLANVALAGSGSIII